MPGIEEGARPADDITVSGAGPLPNAVRAAGGRGWEHA